MENCRSGKFSGSSSFSDERFVSDFVSAEPSGNTLGSSLAKAGSGISRFDIVDVAVSLPFPLKLGSRVLSILGVSSWLPWVLFLGVCNGVFVLEFHTPSISQPLSIALMPKGTSSCSWMFQIIWLRSTLTEAFRSECLLTLLLLRQRIPKAYTRTAPWLW